jgi:hypothetical protein
MWRLRFIEHDGKPKDGTWNYTKGAWLVELSLMEHSPPTYIDSHLLIADARTLPSPRPTTPSTTIMSPSGSMPGTLSFTKDTDSGKPKPMIELRIKTTKSQQLAPHSRARTDSALVDSLHIPLSKNSLANSLQFEYVLLLSACSRLF